MSPKSILNTALLSFIATVPMIASETLPVNMANGIKVGEVTSNSAIVWTRLTQDPERNLTGVEWGENEGIPKGKSLDEMMNSATGVSGELKLEWSLNGQLAGKTDWLAVDAAKDFTRQVELTNLASNQHYTLVVKSRSSGGKSGQTLTGGFMTAPSVEDISPVTFTVVSCQEFSRRDDAVNGHTIYKSMLELKPNFFVHTGDIVYYDYKRSNPKATSAELARFKWNRMFAMPFSRNFHNATTSYFIKDDHDVVRDDCVPGARYGDLTWEQGLDIFREQVPMGERTYRTVRWGKDLQVWFVEGRDFRSGKNKDPDGPEKTIWGKEQKEWFFRTVRESDATFRILISPTPVVGPDRGNKYDNHANKSFTYEGDQIRQFISEQKNMYIVCGDRHWQYVSEDPKTGVREYSCGSTSDKHAGGFSKDRETEMHRYLNVVGGFLSVEIKRDTNGEPIAAMRHHDVAGTVLNEETMSVHN